MALDDSLGSVRNHACETMSLSAAIRQYTGALVNPDFDTCPGPFIRAFQKHREAWLDVTEVTDNYPGLRGEMHDLFDIIGAGKDGGRFQRLIKAIWDTWEEVEEAMNIEQ